MTLNLNRTRTKSQWLLKILVAFVVLLPAAAAPQYSDATITRAESSYKSGKQAYDQERFGDAERHLAASYKQVPLPLTAFMLGCTYAQMLDSRRASNYASAALRGRSSLPRLSARFRDDAQTIVTWARENVSVSSDAKADMPARKPPRLSVPPSVSAPFPRGNTVTRVPRTKAPLVRDHRTRPRGLSGVYTIQQKSNNRYLDAHVTQARDYAVVTRTAQNNDTQRWILTLSGTNTYTIRQRSNARYLDAHVTQARDYAVVTRTAQNNDTQRWILTLSGTNTYTIRQRSNARYLDAHVTQARDYAVVTRTAQNNDTQRWILTLSGTNTYTIRQRSNARYLDAHVTQARDYAVVTRTAQNNDTQRWILTRVGNNLYTVRQKSNGRFLDAHEYSEKDFALVTRTKQDNNTQRWIIKRP